MDSGQSPAVTEIREAFLDVQRHRVVDLGADAAFLEVVAQPIAFGNANHVLVVDVAVARHFVAGVRHAAVQLRGREGPS